VNVKWPNKATEMIETFMVAANNSIGIMLGKEKAPLPWRCHAPPDAPEVEGLNAKFEAMGIDIELPMPSVKKFGQSEEAELASMLGDWAQSGNIQISGLEVSDDQDEVPRYLKNVLDPEARKDILISLQEVQEKASDLESATRRVIDHSLFYLLQRAVYSPDNLGHFGLNLDAYVHFTSPIRRYADLVVHRQLKSFLKEEEWIHSEEEITRISEKCTANSQEAKSIEWELVANAFHLHLLRGGTLDSIKDSNDALELKQWPARVVGLRTPWIFLDLLDDGAIRGKLHVSQLGDGRQLSTDEFGLHLIDENMKESDDIVLSLGQKFPCRLRGLDIWSGELDLAPI
jgi:exoribonuclease R